MAQDFKKYLATEILSEQRTISYRNVSRALKVHVDAAKCMLYEFHELQNGKKRGSVHATYLLSGTKKTPTVAVTKNGINGHGRDYDEDEHIPSSPPPFTSSMLEPSQQSSQAEEEATLVPVRTISLVREEALEMMKAQYETITSIHIYSLSPTRIQDLVTLTDVGRGLFADVFSKEDPLQHNKLYGVIQNPDVRRRKGKRPILHTAAAPKFLPVKEEPKKASAAKSVPEAVAAKTEESSRPSSRDSTSASVSSKPTTKPTTLKRDSSDLFKAFAKQGQKKSTPSSTPKLKDDDTVMKDDDEGESEDEALFLDSNTRKAATSKKRPSDAKKEKDERAAKLRKLFPDDEEEAAVPNVEKASGVENDEPVAAKKGTDADAPSKDVEEVDDDQVAWSDSEGEAEKSGAKQQQADTGPKRRRGKRQVMKKRTMKDEDGYLVTKEEAAWESFSEDEPEPEPIRKELPKTSSGSPKSQSQTQSQAKAGPKKKGAGGGGNIMSFFGKKNS